MLDWWKKKSLLLAFNCIWPASTIRLPAFSPLEPAFYPLLPAFCPLLNHFLSATDLTWAAVACWKRTWCGLKAAVSGRKMVGSGQKQAKSRIWTRCRFFNMSKISWRVLSPPTKHSVHRRAVKWLKCGWKMGYSVWSSWDKLVAASARFSISAAKTANVTAP